MALGTVWVWAESAGDKVTSITLENITKAREIGGTVEAWDGGGGAGGVAGSLGECGVSKVYAVDCGESLPGIPVASAMKAAIDGGNAPDLVMFGSTYDGRDVLARLAVGLDKPVITNGMAVAVDGDDVTVQE